MVRSDPTTVSLCSALAMMFFSEDFKSSLFAGEVWRAIGFIFVAWIGFFLFWCVVSAVFKVVEHKIPEKFKRFSCVIEKFVALIVFVFAYYMGHCVI